MLQERRSTGTPQNVRSSLSLRTESMSGLMRVTRPADAAA